MEWMRARARAVGAPWEKASTSTVIRQAAGADGQEAQAGGRRQLEAGRQADGTEPWDWEPVLVSITRELARAVHCSQAVVVVLRGNNYMAGRRAKGLGLARRGRRKRQGSTGQAGKDWEQKTGRIITGKYSGTRPHTACKASAGHGLLWAGGFQYMWLGPDCCGLLWKPSIQCAVNRALAFSASQRCRSGHLICPSSVPSPASGGADAAQGAAECRAPCRSPHGSRSSIVEAIKRSKVVDVDARTAWARVKDATACRHLACHPVLASPCHHQGQPSLPPAASWSLR